MTSLALNVLNCKLSLPISGEGEETFKLQHVYIILGFLTGIVLIFALHWAIKSKMNEISFYSKISTITFHQNVDELHIFITQDVGPRAMSSNRIVGPNLVYGRELGPQLMCNQERRSMNRAEVYL